MDKLLNVKKPEFKVLDDEAKTETMGKLKVLEFLSEMITNMRESLTRELVVNDVEATDENTAKDEVKII